MQPFRLIFSSAFFIGLMILLLFISFLSYERINRLNQEQNIVFHTSLVKLRLEQVFSYIKDAESAQRGYLLTHDSAFLFPLQSARRNLQDMMNALDSLTADNSSQQKNVHDLQSLINKRIERIYATLFLSDQNKNSFKVSLAEGKKNMDEVKSKISSMQEIENNLMVERRALKDRSAALTPVYTLIFSIFAILILTIAYFRLRTESRLRIEAESSEAKIHRFFNDVPAILAILRGPEHRFEFANPSCLEFIGQNHVVGKTVREIVPEIEEQGYLSLLDHVYKSKEPYVGKEMPLELKRSGVTSFATYINFVLQTFTDESGHPDGILVFCYDVSELVQNRKKIEEAEQRARLAIEAAELGTFDWDLKDQAFISSPRLLEIFGIKGQFEISHQHLLDCFNPADRLVRDRAVVEAFSSGFLHYEARIIRNDKSVRWINVYGKVLYNEDKQPSRMLGTVMDVTIQRTALEEIQESESRFRLLADSMTQLIWTGDPSGSLYYFNNSVYSFTGMHFEDLKKDGWLSIVHPEDRKENNLRWKQSVESGNEFIIEHRLRNSDGKYRWMLSRAIPQRDPDGKIQIWVGTSTDIDEQKIFMMALEDKVKERTLSLQESNRRLEGTILELERTNKELESFNHIASHDLQEPLRKIIAFSRRIEEKELEYFSALSKDYFDRIVAAANRMQNLIDGLSMYRTTNEEKLAFEEVDLNNLLQEIISDLNDSIIAQQAKIIYQDLPAVLAIPIQCYQLFNNLIVNALKYSKPNVAPLIRIRARQVSGDQLGITGAIKHMIYWEISIEDNGIGFEQQFEDKIFELFQRLHPKTDYIGTGIGLAICKKIMNNHHGFIAAKGMSGQGSIFTVYLPVNQEKALYSSISV
jgi:PAS domain S-box-containing protein